MEQGPHLTELKIHGFRGYAIEQSIKFAAPNGKPGSGLTIVVGANNSGKSTIVESLTAVSQRGAPSFSEMQRNRDADHLVKISMTDNTGNKWVLATAGGSEATFTGEHTNPKGHQIFVLPSRRTCRTGQAITELESRSDDQLNQIHPTHGFPLDSVQHVRNGDRASLIRSRLDELIAGERAFMEHWNVTLPVTQTGMSIADSDSSEEE